jgi:hypothetical protein
MTQSDNTQQTTLGGDPKTTLVNQRNTDEFDIDIGRAHNGESNLLNTEVGDAGWLGNPYRISDGYDREEAVAKYREAFRDRLEDDEFREAVEDLRGKTLACWCSPRACHGDVIVEYIREGDV